ncbi:DUF6751 family protein [Paraclostridium sordellii]|uniref:DUF6751 family protein n=1 Tax=Paraclostridium sordellii TaxID=1505 RepID=UPI0005DB79F7|nr:DUF6751 family protein [Paeniclostridium sordellii]CEP83979.1 Uncharacterised protein [[Clostridium] sordellii] [Paeniclostridium sordellii]
MANMTLFNSIYNPETERTEYIRTYLYDIDWQGEQAVTVGDKGLLSADKITCFIPFIVNTKDKKYISPGEFKKLDIEVAKKFYTLKKGDFIVKDIVDFELSSYERGKQFKDLERLYTVGTIVSVITNDFGSEYLQHWEVGAK